MIEESIAEPIETSPFIITGPALLTLLHWIARQNNLDCYTLLEKNDELIKYLTLQADEYGKMPLHYAAAHSQQNIALSLLKHGPLDKQMVAADNDRTPLHYAAKTGSLTLINSLVEKDRNVVLQCLFQADFRGKTALHLAAQHGRVAVVQLLLKLAGDRKDELRSMQDGSKRTALDYAFLGEENPALVEALLT